MRSTAVQLNIPIITTIPGADAAASTTASMRAGGASEVVLLQEIYADSR